MDSTTLDRFIPLRSSNPEAKSVLKTSISPATLSPAERHFRQRDPARNPFSTPTKRRPAKDIQLIGNGNGATTPHHRPSFINDPETPLSARNHRPIRLVSHGSIWSVGGRVAAVPNQIQGVETGDGQTLASGTTAPLIDSGFQNHETESTKQQAHQTRLAFALEIDQASRVLPISPPSSPLEDSL